MINHENKTTILHHPRPDGYYAGVMHPRRLAYTGYFRPGNSYTHPAASGGGAPPQPAAAGSRAMPGDETRINEIQVLLFQPAEDRLVGHYPARNITTTGPDSRSFQVDVIEGTFDIVILANSKDIVDQAGLAEDMSRREVTKRLTFTQDGKIPHNGSTLIPFWGELKNAVIVNNGVLGEVYIHRAWAKIDVILYTDAVKNDFKLQAVTLRHWQKEMALLPAHYDETKEKVTAATDTGSGLMEATTQATYSGTEIDNDEKIEYKIYLNETPNPGINHFPEMPCLILGGEYKGQTCYYRVDFISKNTNGEEFYHDLLRNHQYELRILEILTDGSSSGEDAYNNVLTSIETEIIVWNEGDMKNIIIDGEYWLRVDPAQFTLAREAHQPIVPARAETYSPDDYFFQIESNTNWTIDPATIVYSPDSETGWLTFSRLSGTPGTPADMELYVTENNTTGPRTATFTVAAGTIRFAVTVTQTGEQMTWIKTLDMDGNEINEIDIISRLEESEKVEFVVEWYPHGWNCEVSVATGAGADGLVEYESGDISGGTLTGGANILNFN